MSIHGRAVITLLSALDVAKLIGPPGDDATPNATATTRSKRPSVFHTSAIVRHAGALSAARYATGTAVRPMVLVQMEAVNGLELSDYTN
jgi:hypothetical protein